VIKKTLQKIFKFISYGVFFLIHGKIENSINCNNDKRIEVEKVSPSKDLNYNVYKVEGGRLYTDRIQDTAILIDKNIIEGPSFQFRNNKDSEIYNSNIKNNIVFTKGTPRNLKNLNGSVLSLLTGGAGNNNYWHWMFDVLPRLYLCNHIIKLKNIDYFLIPDDIKKFQKETLDCLNIFENKRLSSKKFRYIKATKLIITDHPVVVSGNASKDIMNIPAWISEWLKDQFLQNLNSKKNIVPKRIYIDRTITNNAKIEQRSIENENEVKNLLLSKNFVAVKLHEKSFKEQIEIFNNAEFVIGLHGGGFANLAFCKPGTKIIELKNLTSGNPIKNLSEKNKLNYSSISVQSKQLDKFKNPNQQGSINIDINQLAEML
jgi:capsular polysaccharide biosynthesis protein